MPSIGYDLWVSRAPNVVRNVLTSCRYRPNLGPTILFSVIFTICVILQVAFGLRMKGYAFLAWMFFGVALECTGWWARVALWQDVWNYAAMIASLAGLIIGDSSLSNVRRRSSQLIDCRS